MDASVTHNIVEESLTGMIGATAIRCTAGSGGRAGTKTKGAGNWFLQNNALATSVHSGPHNFGPLPQGSYWMRPHETDGNKVRLDPFPTNIMFGRSGFLIHGRGVIGSHGCIVPYDFQQVIRICQAVSACAKSKVKPVLRVIAVGDIDYKSSTA